MKVYTASEDANQIETVRLWGFNVTGKCTRAALWFGAIKWGLGYVDVLHLFGPITSLKTRRYYGPVMIKFERSKQ